MNDNNERKSGAYLFSDKIIVETLYMKNEGVWYGSGQMKILTLSVTNLELGEAVLNATGYSKKQDTSYEKIKEHWETLIKRSNYKSEKSFFQNAKYLSIVFSGDRIRFVPFKTSISRRAFARIPDEIKEITPIPDINIIGNQVREGWEKCIFID